MENLEKTFYELSYQDIQNVASEHLDEKELTTEELMAIADLVDINYVEVIANAIDLYKLKTE